MNPTTPPRRKVERAMFINRDQCIGCESRALQWVAGGSFRDDPLRSFIEADPWGISPLPYIEHAMWEYVSCKDCEQRFHRYVLSPEWQTKRYSEWMGEEAIREFERRQALPFSTYFREGQDRTAHVLKIERLTRSIRADEPVRLLDFGCGWGQFPMLASSCGFEAYGIDTDAHRRKGGTGIGVGLYPDLPALDAAVKQRFHAITLFEVLEHLVEPMQVVRSLSERMVAGGILVLEVPNCEGVDDIRSEYDYRKIHPLDHINGFTRDSLRAFAARAGFEEVKPPAAHVTTEPLRIAKTVVKQLARRFIDQTARLYFRLRRT